MNRGFRQHIRYITLYQLKMILASLIAGLGSVVLIMLLSNEQGVYKTSYLKLFQNILLVVPGVFMMTFLCFQKNLCLSMGCLRKNIYLGLHILTAEMLLESSVFYLITELVFHHGIVPTKYLWYLIVGILLIVTGTVYGLVINRFGHAGITAVIVISSVIAVLIGAVLILITNRYFYTYGNNHTPLSYYAKILRSILSSPSAIPISAGAVLILYGLTLFWAKRELLKDTVVS